MPTTTPAKPTRTTATAKRPEHLKLAELGRAAIAKKRADRRRSGRPQSITPRADKPARRRKPLPKTDRRPIEINVDYPVETFLLYTGMTDSGLRKLQRRGLNVRFTGSRRMILGQHWIEFVEREAKADTTNREGGAS
jgi:hypothetical protein